MFGFVLCVLRVSIVELGFSSFFFLFFSYFSKFDGEGFAVEMTETVLPDGGMSHQRY